MHIVALRTVRYNDSQNILTAYSRETGRAAFLLPAGGGKEAVRRRCLLQPMSLAEIVAQVTPGREISRLGEVRPMIATHGIAANPIKTSVALFLAEVLGVALREGGADARLFDFIAHSVRVLDATPTQSAANFHLRFLWGLGEMLGIAPDTGSYRPGTVFDMTDGTFRSTPPLHNDFLMSDEAPGVARLARMTYANMGRFRMNRTERDHVLELMMRYFSIHHADMSGIRSLEILRTLFQ